MESPRSISRDQEESPVGAYGFFGRLKVEFPSQLILDITEICNLACIHCPHPEFSKSDHYSGAMMDPELNAKLVEEVRRHGQGHTQYIRFTSMGEPTTHPACFDMIEHAVRNSGVTVTLTTNGKILDEARAERLLATGVDIVDISLDAFHPETYAKIRVRGDLQVTRANVLNLIKKSKERGSKTRVIVSYIEQPLNTQETSLFQDYWKGQGADYVVIRRLHSCSGSKTQLAEISRQENKDTPRRPCLYPWERIILNARGHLSFCPADWAHAAFVADYRTTTIYETWRGEFYQKLRDAHLKNIFSNHSFCGQCPDWKTTRWPHQGRSYADMVQEFKDLE